MKAGDVIAGRYRILRPIGAGAMSTVWAARHELLDRDVAIKIATVGDRSGPSARARFAREARIVARLRHPNIVHIVDAGDVGTGELYLAMELLQGKSLAHRIVSRGLLPPGETVAVVAEVCRGLSAAHAAGVVHHDIKPENIFLAHGLSGGVVPKLLDFGVSSARGVPTAGPGQVVGTPAYMSPEQALGEGLDPRADLWSLGVVMYEMLTGRLPFSAKSYPALLPLIIEAPFPALPASIPPEICTVLAGCLAKERGDRYPTANALLDALLAARAQLAASDLGPSSGTSGFFVETGHGAAMDIPPGFLRQAEREAHGSRRSLALAVGALSLALVGVAVSGMNRSHGTTPLVVRTAATVDEAPILLSPCAAAVPSSLRSATKTGDVSPTARLSSPSVAASSPSPTMKPEPHRPGKAVTRIDNAGF